jgi:hypothetical protein
MGKSIDKNIGEKAFYLGEKQKTPISIGKVNRKSFA